ncbi:pirin family protein [Glaciecola sp. 1036]|uniref:pirin family protein n=1 Tax=Alteromonadaceae TaxID=72275 RepID=UPI003D03235E
MKFTAPFGYHPMQHGAAFDAKQYNVRQAGLTTSPVLNIDWFKMTEPTFPPHPHAGFSAITYLFPDSPGGFINKDSQGYVGDILPGDMHWTMAASGIVHDEIPIENGVMVEGFQIFMNLPEEHQLLPAKAFRIKAEDMLIEKSSSGYLRFAIKGNENKGESLIPFNALIGEMVFTETGELSVEVPACHSGLLVALNGDFSVSDKNISEFNAIGFESAGTETLKVQANGGTKIAIVAGDIMTQPVFHYGPFIMSSKAKLIDRIEAYNRGEFGKIE